MCCSILYMLFHYANRSVSVKVLISQKAKNADDFVSEKDCTTYLCI
uniref:Uncharacterized protein n=1 Tax=Rhizophora mucronata TaxID=61149 RepID=A0A2P2IZY8_RHIMU